MMRGNRGELMRIDIEQELGGHVPVDRGEHPGIAVDFREAQYMMALPVICPADTAVTSTASAPRDPATGTADIISSSAFTHGSTALTIANP